MNKILNVMEDIKQNITDNQYKTIMDSLMAINKDPIIYKNHENNKFLCLLKWLDTKLQLTDCSCDSIKRNELYKFVITEYFNDVYQNKDFVKQVVNIFFFMHEKEKGHSNLDFYYVKYRNRNDHHIYKKK